MFLLMYVCIRTVVNCGQPSPINNGGTLNVGPTTYQSIAVYSCPNGYTLSVENSVRRCLADSNWSGLDPSCDRELFKKSTL